MRRDFFQRMKKIFRDWDIKVMSYVMLVVTATCVIAATVAWFTSHAAVSVNNMEIKTASTEVIRVAVVAGGEDIDSIRAQGEAVEMSLKMPQFYNVSGQENEKVLAPGVYGTITLYVTALKPEIGKCKVIPSFFGTNGEKEGLTYVDVINELADVEAEKTLLKNLVQGHILFFETCTTENGVVTYSNQLTTESPIIRTLEWDDNAQAGIEEEVTIYWYWPYEYEDIPQEIKADIEDARELFFEPDKDETGNYSDSKLYDYADTRIGSYIENVKFHVEVSAGYGKAAN